MGNAYELKGTVGVDLNPLQAGLGQGLGLLRDFAAEAGGLGTVLAGAFGVATVAKLTATTLELGKIGAQADRVEQSFQQLSDAPDALIAKLKEASGETIGANNLMLASNRAALLGLGTDAEKMGQLMEVARFRGRAMGETVAEAYSDIVTGVGRMSPMILDNLGIVVDAEQTYAGYARTLGKNADALSDVEKKQALMNRVIDEGQRQIKAAGGLADDAADSFERYGAKVGDLKESIAKLAVGPATVMVNFAVSGVDAVQAAVDKIKANDPTTIHFDLAMNQTDVTTPTDLAYFNAGVMPRPDIAGLAAPGTVPENLADLQAKMRGLTQAIEEHNTMTAAMAETEYGAMTALQAAEQEFYAYRHTVASVYGAERDAADAMWRMSTQSDIMTMRLQAQADAVLAANQAARESIGANSDAALGYKELAVQVAAVHQQLTWLAGLGTGGNQAIYQNEIVAYQLMQQKERERYLAGGTQYNASKLSQMSTSEQEKINDYNEKQEKAQADLSDKYIGANRRIADDFYEAMKDKIGKITGGFEDQFAPSGGGDRLARQKRGLPDEEAVDEPLRQMQAAINNGNNSQWWGAAVKLSGTENMDEDAAKVLMREYIQEAYAHPGLHPEAFNVPLAREKTAEELAAEEADRKFYESLGTNAVPAQAGEETTMRKLADMARAEAETASAVGPLFKTSLPVWVSNAGDIGGGGSGGGGGGPTEPTDDTGDGRYGDDSKYDTKHGMASGGVVPGSPGTPVPIVAHGGEVIFNAVQQAALAGLLGGRTGNTYQVSGPVTIKSDNLSGFFDELSDLMQSA